MTGATFCLLAHYYDSRNYDGLFILHGTVKQTMVYKSVANGNESTLWSIQLNCKKVFLQHRSGTSAEQNCIPFDFERVAEMSIEFDEGNAGIRVREELVGEFKYKQASEDFRIGIDMIHSQGQ